MKGINEEFGKKPNISPEEASAKNDLLVKELRIDPTLFDIDIVQAKSYFEDFYPKLVELEKDHALLDQALFDADYFFTELRYALTFISEIDEGKKRVVKSLLEKIKERAKVIDLREEIQHDTGIGMLRTYLKHEDIKNEEALIFNARVVSLPNVLGHLVNKNEKIVVIDAEGKEITFPQEKFPKEFILTLIANSHTQGKIGIETKLNYFFLAHHFYKDLPEDVQKILREYLSLLISLEGKTTFSNKEQFQNIKNALWTDWIKENLWVFLKNDSETAQVVGNIFEGVPSPKIPSIIRAAMSFDVKKTNLNSELRSLIGDVSLDEQGNKRFSIKIEEFRESIFAAIQRKAPSKKEKKTKKGKKNNGQKGFRENGENKVPSLIPIKRTVEKEVFFDAPQIEHKFDEENLDFTVKNWPEGANLHACVILSQEGKRDKTERITFSDKAMHLSLWGVQDAGTKKEDKQFKVIFHFFPEKEKMLKTYEEKAPKYETEFVIKKEKKRSFVTLDQSPEKNQTSAAENSIEINPDTAVLDTKGKVENVVEPPRIFTTEDLLELALCEIIEKEIKSGIEIDEAIPGIFKLTFTASQFETVERDFEIIMNKQGQVIGGEFGLGIKHSAKEFLFPILKSYIKEKEAPQIKEFTRWYVEICSSAVFQKFSQEEEEFDDQGKTNYHWIQSLYMGTPSRERKDEIQTMKSCLEQDILSLGGNLKIEEQGMRILFEIEGSKYEVGVSISGGMLNITVMPKYIPEIVSKKLIELTSKIGKYLENRITPKWVQENIKKTKEQRSNQNKTCQTDKEEGVVEQNKIERDVLVEALARVLDNDGRIPIFDEVGNLVKVEQGKGIEEVIQYGYFLIKDSVFLYPKDTAFLLGRTGMSDDIGNEEIKERKDRFMRNDEKMYDTIRYKLNPHLNKSIPNRNRKLNARKIVETVKIRKELEGRDWSENPIKCPQIQKMIEDLLKEVKVSENETLWDNIEKIEHMGDLMDLKYSINGTHWLDEFIDRLQKEGVPLGFSHCVVASVEKTLGNPKVINDPRIKEKLIEKGLLAI